MSESCFLASVVAAGLTLAADALAMPVEVTAPNFKCKGTFPALDARSLGNAEIYLFDQQKPVSFKLRGSAARVRKSGRVDSVGLQKVILLPSRGGGLQSAAVFVSWTVAGASSWNGCYVQVLTRDHAGQVVVAQQIHYGCGVEGARADYDPKAQTLTVKSGATDAADSDPKARCAVARFEWEGRRLRLVQTRRIPRRPGADPADPGDCK